MNRSWVEWLPAFLRTRIEHRYSLQGILANTGWLMADNVFRMVLGVLVGAWVARYLGPEQFGELAYVLAFVAFFQAASKLGLDSIVIRDIAHDVDSAPAILGTVLRLRLITGLVCWAAAIGGMALLRPGDATALLLVAIIASTVIFQAIDTIDLWFQSCTQSRRTVIAKTSALLGVSLIRVVLILAKAPLVAFAGMMLIETVLVALALVWMYRHYPAPAAWIWQVGRARQLLWESWPFLLSGIAVLIYIRIDQLMLFDMVSEHELGIYSAALPLSTAWYFVPVAICASVAPALARKKDRSEAEYMTALECLFSLMWWYTLPLCIVIALLSEPLIGLLYGPAYAASAAVLAVHVFANMPVALGVVQSQWIVNERRNALSLYKTTLGAISNVLLNLYLIPRYGAMGAAVATVVSFWIAGVFSNILCSLVVFRLQIKALVKII